MDGKRIDEDTDNTAARSTADGTTNRHVVAEDEAAEDSSAAQASETSTSETQASKAEPESKPDGTDSAAMTNSADATHSPADTNAGNAAGSGAAVAVGSATATLASPKPASHRLTSIVLLVLSVVVIVGLLVDVGIARRRAAQVHAYESEQAQLARQYGFNPGLIIADDEMTDSTSMSADDIQDFLDTRGVNCSGDACLATKTFDTRDESKDALCDGYAKASGETAAQIISGVATSCRINPKALLVMLQKEQGLVTATDPTDKSYTIAMGLSCPDDGDCDAAYYGFFNQVYGAAHRLKYYQAHFEDYNYRPHETAYIQYNPDESCSGTKVYIENDATAMLYNYTPYQPNTAALEGLADGTGGEGDSCSTYGNRNFTLYYNAWFGDPTRGEGTNDDE